MTITRKLIAPAVLIATLALTAGCAGKSPGEAPAGAAPAATQPAATQPAATGPVTIELNHMKFHPAQIEIAAGTAVTFVNKDNSADHSVYEGDPKKKDAAKFSSKDLKNGESFVYTFDKPGTYDIYCETDSHWLQGMKAKVTVK